MKNIEKYFDKLKEKNENYNNINCTIHHVKNDSESCGELDCEDCQMRNLEWLNEEYHETIKLTKFEYDLLKTNDQSHQRSIGSYKTYVNMKKVGYYNGIKNWDMPIVYILNHCEVISNGN